MRFGLWRLVWHGIILDDWTEEQWLEEVARFEARKRWFFWLQRDRDKW